MTNDQNHFLRGCWLTTNRACNLRCKWCYAADTGFKPSDDMPFEDAKKVVIFCKEAGIRTIILLGGEPSIYPFIHDLIRFIKSQGLRSVMVTNGIVLADLKTAKKFVEDGLSSFSLSMKGNSKQEYLETTGFDGYDLFLRAIRNLCSLGVKPLISQVLTPDNIATFPVAIRMAKEAGAKRFSFSFCYDFNCSGAKGSLGKNNPFVLSFLFNKNAAAIESALDGCHYALSEGLPLCVWEKGSLRELIKGHHITSICQLQKGTGILFDTDLSVIPCNAMHSLKYGKFGKDFTDPKTYFQYLQDPKVAALFAQLRGIPDKQCLTCQKASRCGGGCVTNWTNYSFADLHGKLKEEANEIIKNIG